MEEKLTEPLASHQYERPGHRNFRVSTKIETKHACPAMSALCKAAAATAAQDLRQD